MRSKNWLSIISISDEKVEYVTHKICRFPNFAGSDNERSALDEFRTFEPLIQIKCSQELQFFLCASYFPLCNDKVSDPIGPCQPLCKRVRSQCVSVLKEFDYPWPAHLECDKFLEGKQ